METTPWFTHPQAILGVYNFLLSDEYKLAYIKHTDASELENGRQWIVSISMKLKKSQSNIK